MTLKDCLRLFTKEDELDGEESPVRSSTAPLAKAPKLMLHFLSQMCCRCKSRRKCSKRFSIQRFPQILVLRILTCLSDHVITCHLLP